MPVSIRGSAGGSVTLSSGAAASDTTLTLPNTTGTVALTASPTFSGTVTATTVTSPASTALTIQSAGTTAMTIDTSQNVGVGGSPLARLSAASSGLTGLFTSSATGTTVRSNSVFRIQSEATGRDVYMQFSDNVTNATEIGMVSGSQYFCTAGSERMRIDSSGNLLVGQTSSGVGQRFSVTSTGTWNSFLYIPNGQQGIGITNTSGTSSYTAMTYYNNGTTYSFCGSITVSGTTTAFNTSSDYRMKENVVPITTGLATIGALKPISYDWISTKERGEGFLAHELQEIVPLAVTGDKDAVDEDGKMKPQSVDYSKIVVHLVAAIQELSAKNDALEARLAALEAK